MNSAQTWIWCWRTFNARLLDNLASAHFGFVNDANDSNFVFIAKELCFAVVVVHRCLPESHVVSWLRSWIRVTTPELRDTNFAKFVFWVPTLSVFLWFDGCSAPVKTHEMFKAPDNTHHKIWCLSPFKSGAWRQIVPQLRSDSSFKGRLGPIIALSHRLS